MKHGLSGTKLQFLAISGYQVLNLTSFNQIAFKNMCQLGHWLKKPESIVMAKWNWIWLKNETTIFALWTDQQLDVMKSFTFKYLLCLELCRLKKKQSRYFRINIILINLKNGHYFWLGPWWIFQSRYFWAKIEYDYRRNSILIASFGTLDLLESQWKKQKRR